MDLGRGKEVNITARRAANRVREFFFPLSSGLGAARFEDIISPTNRVSLELEDWNGDLGAGSFWDLTALVTIARHLQPKRIFEIGTGHGRTTLNLALNTPPDARIFTLDISDGPVVGKLFKGHPAAGKIQTLTADSVAHDYSEFANNIELVLVDGNHGYDSVVADTKSAFGMVAPKGIILWDDVHPAFDGVVRALKQRPEASQIRRIVGTKLAVYQR